jgi:ATP-dependent RNA helicase DeaD
MAKRYQNNALRVTTKEEEKQHVDIEYQAISIAPNDRENAIINMLRYHEAQNAIIFCGTRAAVNLMKSRLNNRGFSVVAISGELSQAERSNALQALRDGRASVCVATDVAARGIDLPGLALVIHADLPKNKDILLHRSGRTGRAGSKGISALVVPHNGRSRAERMLKSAKLNATWGKPPSIEDIQKRDQERFLNDPALVDPIKEEEKEAAAKLLESHGAEQIAAALLRLHNKQKPAPEELLDFTPPKKGDKKKQHEDFGKSVWVSLSVGRDDRAEPRWIVPMLCGAGNMTNRQIGAIRIHAKETHAELSIDCIDKFFELVDKSGGKLERNITVTRLDHVPDAPKGRIDRGNRPNKHRGKSSDDGKPNGDFKKKKYKDKSDSAPWGDKPNGEKKPYKGKSNNKPKGDHYKKNGTPLGKKKPKKFTDKNKTSE